jgi:nicotinamide mononucleotide transporter
LTSIEIFAAVLGFTAVLLTIRRNVWCWPIGLGQVVLYIAVFYQAKLYSDMLLHVVYVALQFYGWAAWLASRRGPRIVGAGVGSAAGRDLPEPTVRVERMTSGQFAAAIVVCIAGTAVIGWSMQRFTDAAAPYADAFIAATSLVAQGLLAKRQLQNWWLWIAVDVVAVVVFTQRELYPTAGLYGVFLIMAVYGAVAWRRSLLNGERSPNWLTSAERATQ